MKPLLSLSRSAALQAQLAPLQQRWQALAPRERLGATLGLGLLLVFLVWSLAVQPALKTLRTAPAQQATLDAQLAQMQRLAAEASELRALPRSIRCRRMPRCSRPPNAWGPPPACSAAASASTSPSPASSRRR